MESSIEQPSKKMRRRDFLKGVAAIYFLAKLGPLAKVAEAGGEAFGEQTVDLNRIGEELLSISKKAQGRTINFSVNQEDQVVKNAVNILDKERSSLETFNVFTQSESFEGNPKREKKVKQLSSLWSDFIKSHGGELKSGEIFISDNFVLIKKPDKYLSIYILGHDDYPTSAEEISLKVSKFDLEKAAVMSSILEDISSVEERVLIFNSLVRYENVNTDDLKKLRDYLKTVQEPEKRAYILSELSHFYIEQDIFFEDRASLTSLVEFYQEAGRILGDTMLELIGFSKTFSFYFETYYYHKFKRFYSEQEGPSKKIYFKETTEGFTYLLEQTKKVAESLNLPIKTLLIPFIIYEGRGIVKMEDKRRIVQAALEGLESDDKSHLHSILNEAYKQGRGKLSYQNGGFDATPNLWEMMQLNIPSIVSEVSEETGVPVTLILTMLAREGLGVWVKELSRIEDSGLEDYLSLYLTNYLIGSFSYLGIDQPSQFLDQLVKAGYLPRDYTPFIGKKEEVKNELSLPAENMIFKSLKEATHFQTVLVKYYIDEIEKDVAAMNLSLEPKTKKRMVFAYYNMGPENGKKFMQWVATKNDFDFEDYKTWGDWSQTHFEYSNRGFATLRFYEDIVKDEII